MRQWYGFKENPAVVSIFCIWFAECTYRAALLYGTCSLVKKLNRNLTTKNNPNTLYHSVGTSACELGHGHMATGYSDIDCAHASTRLLSSCGNQKWFLCFIKRASTAFIIFQPSAHLWAWSCSSSCPVISETLVITWTI